jgi:hypothetical protein
MALRLRAEDAQRPVWALVDRNSWKNLPEAQKAAWEVKGASPSCTLVTLR